MGLVTFASIRVDGYTTRPKRDRPRWDTLTWSGPRLVGF